MKLINFPSSSKYKNKFTGTSADIGGFSFNRHKHIQTGEGGIVITNNKEYAKNMYKIRNHGEVINKDNKFLSNWSLYEVARYVPSL